MKIILIPVASILFLQCNTNPPQSGSVAETTREAFMQQDGGKILGRFPAPMGYHRVKVDDYSFEYFLRNLPLKPAGSRVKYFNGQYKDNPVHAAVIDLDVGNEDLQQCADAVIRLRAEYFYTMKLYDSIQFILTNGFKMKYTDWMQGNRLKVSGNSTSWQKIAKPSNTYREFRNYLNAIFRYAGTISLARELRGKRMEDMLIGDVLVRGGSPGHAVIVVDMAENACGEKKFLLAQSYMPAQEMHVLQNFNEPEISPWYTLKPGEGISTPEWTFTHDQLKAW